MIQVGDHVVWNRSRHGVKFQMYGVVEAIDGDRVTAVWSTSVDEKAEWLSLKPPKMAIRKADGLLLRHRAPIESVEVVYSRRKPAGHERAST